MLRVHRTETDEIVLLHEPSQTVVVDDTFDGAMARMRERLGDELNTAMRPPPEPATAATPSTTARYGLLAVLALLPFVWLGALHVSLGALVAELRRDVHAAERDASEASGDAAERRADIDAIGRRVDRLVDQVAKLEHRAKHEPAARDLPDDDEGDDDGDDETGEADAEAAPTAGEPEETPPEPTPPRPRARSKAPASRDTPPT